MAGRNPRFSSTEVEILINACVENITVLQNGDNSERIKAAKDKAWNEITERVNSVNTTGKQRLPKECRKKWFDLRSRTKAKVATNNQQHLKTGGGASGEVEMTATDQAVVRSFVEEELHGLPGFESGQPLDTDAEVS